MLEPRHRYSVRLRRRKDEVREYRRSGNFVVTGDKSEDTKVATLDPVVGDTGMQHNLRPLLRNIYMKRESGDMKYPVDMHRRQVRLKHFGLIDKIQDESLGENTR